MRLKFVTVLFGFVVLINSGSVLANYPVPTSLTIQNIDDPINNIEHNGGVSIRVSPYSYKGFVVEEKKNGHWSVFSTPNGYTYGADTVGISKGNEEGTFRYRIKGCDINSNNCSAYSPETPDITFVVPTPDKPGVPFVYGVPINESGITQVEVNSFTVRPRSTTGHTNRLEVKREGQDWQFVVELSHGQNRMDVVSNFETRQYRTQSCKRGKCSEYSDVLTVRVDIPETTNTDTDYFWLHDRDFYPNGNNTVNNTLCKIPEGKDYCHEDDYDLRIFYRADTYAQNQGYPNSPALELFINGKKYTNINYQDANYFEIQDRYGRGYDDILFGLEPSTLEIREGIYTRLLTKVRGVYPTKGSLSYESCNISEGEASCSTILKWTRTNNEMGTCLFKNPFKLTSLTNKLKCWDKGITEGEMTIDIGFSPDLYAIASIENAQAQYYPVLASEETFALYQGVTLSAEPKICTIYSPDNTCLSTISWDTAELPQGCLFHQNGTLAFCTDSGSVEVSVSQAGATYFLRADSSVDSQILGAVKPKGNKVAIGSLSVISGQTNPCEPASGETTCEITLNIHHKGVTQSNATLYKNGENLGFFGISSDSGVTYQQAVPVENDGTLYELRGGKTADAPLLDSITLYTANLETDGYALTLHNNDCIIQRRQPSCAVNLSWNIGAEQWAMTEPGNRPCLFLDGVATCLQAPAGDGALQIKNGKSYIQIRKANSVNAELMTQALVYAEHEKYSEILATKARCEISTADLMRDGEAATCSIQFSWFSNQPCGNSACSADFDDICLLKDGENTGICNRTQLSGKSNLAMTIGAHKFSVAWVKAGVITNELASVNVEATKAFAPVFELTVQSADPDSTDSIFVDGTDKVSCTIVNGDSCPVIISWRTNTSVCITTSSASSVEVNDAENLACTNGQTPDTEGFFIGSKPMSLSEGLTHFRMLAFDYDRYSQETAVVEAYVGLPLLEVITSLTISRPTNNSLNISWPKDNQATLYQLQHFVSDNELTPEEQTQIADTSWTLIASIPSSSVTGNVVSFIDENLAQGRHYYYRVRACNGDAQCGL